MEVQFRITYTGAAQSLQGAKAERTRRNRGKGGREKKITHNKA